MTHAFIYNVYQFVGYKSAGYSYFIGQIVFDPGYPVLCDTVETTTTIEYTGLTLSIKE